MERSETSPNTAHLNSSTRYFYCLLRGRSWSEKVEVLNLKRRFQVKKKCVTRVLHVFSKSLRLEHDRVVDPIIDNWQRTSQSTGDLAVKFSFGVRAS